MGKQSLISALVIGSPAYCIKGFFVNIAIVISCKYTKICIEKELFLPFCCVDCHLRLPCRPNKLAAHDSHYLDWGYHIIQIKSIFA